MKKIDLLCVSSNETLIERCEQVARDFNYTFALVANDEELMNRESEFKDVTLIVLASLSSNQSEIVGVVQVARQFFVNSHILAVVDSRLTPEQAAFIKKSGASLVIQDKEVVLSSKLEFMASQKIRASYVPIKSSELKVGSKFGCDLFHLMPLNRKFLPVIKAGTLIEANKLEKVNEVGEVYIRREDLSHYTAYLKEYDDKSANGLSRRCRSQFLELSTNYADLVLLIADQSEYSSFEKGKALFESCEKMAGDLLTNLAALGNSWEVVNNSAVGEFGSVERGPALAAYAGILSLNCNIGEPKQVMLAALLADIGMLELNPKITKKVRDQDESKMHPEDLQYYQNHPIASLNMALGRRLPLPEKMKEIILCTHERADRSGFPKRLRGEDIPFESYLIAFCELVDRASIIRMGKQRVDVRAALNNIFQDEVKKADHFSIVFLESIRKNLSL